jgi:hypothetical protein
VSKEDQDRSVDPAQSQRIEQCRVGVGKGIGLPMAAVTSQLLMVPGVGLEPTLP